MSRPSRLPPRRAKTPGAPLDLESSSLVLSLPERDRRRIKEELNAVKKKTGIPAKDVAVRILVHCLDHYAAIVEHPAMPQLPTAAEQEAQR